MTTAAIVRADLKAYTASPLERVGTSHLVPNPGVHLIDHGAPLVKRPASRVQHEMTTPIDLQSVGAVELQQDRVRIGPGRELDVVLQLTLVPMEGQIDTGQDIVVAHPRIRRDVGLPLRRVGTDEVVDLAWQFIEPRHPGRRFSAHDLHPDGSPGRARRRHGDDDVATRQEQAVTGTTGQELHVGVGLPAIDLEAQGQPCERRTQLCAPFGVRVDGSGMAETRSGNR